MAEIQEYKCPCCGGAIAFDSRIQKMKCPFCDTEFEMETMGDENTAATSCPFCGNAVVMTERFSGSLRPDYVIPFKLDKRAAKEALKNHYKGKRLLPKIFKDENHIDEVKGVYVPFWLFDAKANADIRYKATRVRSWSDSRYDYTETSYYTVRRRKVLKLTLTPWKLCGILPKVSRRKTCQWRIVWRQRQDRHTSTIFTGNF